MRACHSCAQTWPRVGCQYCINLSRLARSALAAAASGGDVEQAPAESPQSGGDSRNAQKDRQS